MALEIRLLDSRGSADWDSFVNSCPDASHYHLLAWKSFYEEKFSKKTYYFTAYEEGKIVGVLPLVRQKSLMFGDYLVSLPFVNYGGVLAKSDAVAVELLRVSAELAIELGVEHIELREYRPREGYPARTEKVSMRLQLPASVDMLSKSLGAKLRSQIRRSEREGTTVSAGKVELLDRFYDVFSRNMRDLGTPVYSRSMFEDILLRFPQQTDLIVVELGTKTVAGGFLIHYRNCTEVPWASADRRYNKISVNMALYWELLKFSLIRGSKVFDFGRSSRDSGTYRFKKQWGANPQSLCWNYWLNDGVELPALNPQNKKYELAIGIWKKLPLSISKFVGPHIVRHLP